MEIPTAEGSIRAAPPAPQRPPRGEEEEVQLRCSCPCREKPDGDDSAPQRPKHTLFGFKDQPTPPPAEPVCMYGIAAALFLNKEKVLMTCSRPPAVAVSSTVQKTERSLPAYHHRDASQGLAQLSAVLASETLMSSHSCTKAIAAPAPNISLSGNIGAPLKLKLRHGRSSQTDAPTLEVVPSLPPPLTRPCRDRNLLVRHET